MGLFGHNKQKIRELEQENQNQRKWIKQLENLCEEKDSYFTQLMSDALKKRSSLAGKPMADRREYLKTNSRDLFVF